VRRLGLVAVVLASSCSGSCGGGEVKETPRAAARAAPDEHWQGSLSPKPSPDAIAVAEVNGDTIWDVDVARHARERHLDARAALAELVDLQLLAQEAMRRGLADDPQVAETRKQARVRAVMNTGFATAFASPADVPQADIDVAWSNPRIYLKFNHQLYHEVRFARFEFKREAPPERVEELRQKAEKVRAAAIAAHPATKEAFTDVVVSAARELGEVVTTQDHAATERGTVKDFLDAAMALKAPGDISPVTRTDWGWDILYLYNIIPEVKLTKEQATPELRQRIFDESRSQRFLAWVDGLVRAAHVTRHDELLADDPDVAAAGTPRP
jgi:hypothetical protein